MPRQPRLHIQNAYYHVMLRGNNKQPIFFTHEDRNFFYSLIEEGVERYNYRIHAFCLMTNHIHLLLQITDISISKIIQNLTFRYTGRINRRYTRVGHLFQGRFKAKLVSTDEYLIQLIKYIHLNPVEAKVVTNADDYPWSSHRAYLHLEEIDWLTKKYMLGLLGKHDDSAMKKYQDLFKNSDDMSSLASHDIKSMDLQQDDFLLERKTDQLKEKMTQPFTMEHVISYVCRQYHMDELDLQKASRKHSHAKVRAVIAWIVSQLKLATITRVAQHFKRDVTGIIRTVHRLERDEVCRAEMFDIMGKLIKSTSQA